MTPILCGSDARGGEYRFTDGAQRRSGGGIRAGRAAHHLRGDGRAAGHRHPPGTAAGRLAAAPRARPGGRAAHLALHVAPGAHHLGAERTSGLPPRPQRRDLRDRSAAADRERSRGPAHRGGLGRSRRARGGGGRGRDPGLRAGSAHRPRTAGGPGRPDGGRSGLRRVPARRHALPRGRGRGGAARRAWWRR